MDVKSLSGERLELRNAVERSKNGVAWYIYDDITPDVGMAYLTQMRFASVQAADYYPATSLGGFTTGMTTEEMAGAYAALSDRGQYREPTCIIKMINNQGEGSGLPGEQRRADDRYFKGSCHKRYGGVDGVERQYRGGRKDRYDQRQP